MLHIPWGKAKEAGVAHSGAVPMAVLEEAEVGWWYIGWVEALECTADARLSLASHDPWAWARLQSVFVNSSDQSMRFVDWPAGKGQYH